MGVTGDLESDVEPRRRVDGARLMGEQHDFARRIAAGEGSVGIVAMADVVPIRVEVVDAGQIERRLAVADDDALVVERAEAELGEVGDPRARAGVVFVIASHEVDAVFRLQIGERRHLITEAGDGPVDEIARDDDDVGERALTRATTSST